VINPKIQAMLAEKVRKEAAMRNAFRAFMSQARAVSVVSPSTCVLLTRIRHSRARYWRVLPNHSIDVQTDPCC